MMNQLTKDNFHNETKEGVCLVAVQEEIVDCVNPDSSAS